MGPGGCDLIDALLLTVVRRPYVVAFLLTFLVLSILNRGLRGTLQLLCVGYGIAFLSEWCSINWGWPYGDYSYRYEAMEGELILAGVPMWDSVSYVFIAYASAETARWLGWRSKVWGPALLMTLADVLIDPIALRGERWFLGQVYEYHHDGIYFGVPLSNFAGWFVVGVTILGIDNALQRIRGAAPPPERAVWLGPLFYASILAFISIVGITIGETAIVLTSLSFQLPIWFWRFRTVAR